VDEGRLIHAHERTRGVAERIARELDCDTAVRRYLCPLTHILTSGPSSEEGQATPLPDGTWLGVSVMTRPSRTIDRGANETVAAARVKISEGAIAYSSLLPSTADEKQLLRGAVRELVPNLRGEEREVKISDWTSILLDFNPVEMLPLHRDAMGWGFEADNPSRVYVVPSKDGAGETLVVTEVLEAHLSVSVFALQDPVIDEGVRP
jgi:hypothetical protein